MNVLIDKLPDAVSVCGDDIPINTDFRAGIKFEQLIMRGCSNADELLGCFFSDLPEKKLEALAAAIAYYAGDLKLTAEQTDRKHPDPVYDYDTDSAAIYTSFLSAYGIDLATTQMHWYLFRYLLLQLPDDTRFKQIVRIRTSDTKGMSAKQKQLINKLKKTYAIKKDNAQKETLEERNKRWNSVGR